jgi:hypothetical protein
MTKKEIEQLVALRLDGLTWREISLHEDFTLHSPNSLRKAFYRHVRDNKNIDSKLPTSMKFLTIDIETAPMEVYAWGTWDQNISLDMIIKDWTILSFSAKWLHDDKVIYMDTSKEKDVRNDQKLVKALWVLLEQADVILSQNGVRFDIPKINSRFKAYNLAPPSSFRHIDALKINRKNFGDTSNKLEYQTHKFCRKFKKSGHKKFPGFALWKACLAGNKDAWEEMKDYNQIDVLALEELYTDVLRRWDKSLQFNVYTDTDEYRCSCGSTDFRKNGFIYTNRAKFQRYTCNSCGQHHQDNENLLTKEKRKSLRK